MWFFSIPITTVPAVRNGNLLKLFQKQFVLEVAIDGCFFWEKVQMQVLDFATDKRTEWEKDHKLYSVIFELTPRCNLNCVHCYLNQHHASKELSYEEIIEIIDILYEKEVLFLTFTGGDVFVRKDFLDIYMYAKCER